MLRPFIIIALFSFWFLFLVVDMIDGIKFMIDRRELLFADYNHKMLHAYYYSNYDYNLIYFFKLSIPENATVIFEYYSDKVFLSYFLFPRKLLDININLTQTFLINPEAEYAIIRGGFEKDDGTDLKLVVKKSFSKL